MEELLQDVVLFRAKSGDVTENPAASLAATVRLLLSQDLQDKTFWLIFGKKCSVSVELEWFDFNETNTADNYSSQVQNTTSSPDQSVFGSPLKLQSIANLSNDDKLFTSTPTEIAKKIIEYLPAVSLTKAKQILSMFSKKKLEDSEPSVVIVLCYDTEHPRQHMLCGMYRGSAENLSEIGTFSVVKLGDTRVKLETMELSDDEQDCKMAASYNILEQRDGMGWITLDARWSDPKGRLKLSNLTRTVFALNLSVQSGNEHSPVFAYFCELQKARKFVSVLKSQEMPEVFFTRKVGNTLQMMKDCLNNLKRGCSPPVCSETTGASSIAKHLKLEPRQNKDFTDYLWDIVSQCSDLDSLSQCLCSAFAALKRGDLQVFVNSENQTTIAQLVKQSQSGMAYFPSLSGFLPVRLVAEVGVHKVFTDLMSVFICNKLCTASQWDNFVKSQTNDTDTNVKDMEEIYNNALFNKIDILSKLHHILEVVSVLDVFTENPNLGEIAISLMTQYKNKDLNEAQVLRYPVTAVQAAQEVNKMSPSMISRETLVRGTTNIDCFLSELPGCLSFLPETSVNPGDVSTILGDVTDYHHIQTTDRKISFKKL